LRIERGMCNDHPMSDDDRLISSSEASQILGINKTTLHRWLQCGRIAAAQKLPGHNGAYLFRYAVVARLAAERRAA